MDDLYICLEDRQGGEFAVGGLHTIEGWRQRAMSWAESDDNDETYAYLDGLKDEMVIDFIDDFWEITIEPLNEVLPIDDLSVIKQVCELLRYISSNAIALREMQSFLNMQSEEYAEYTEDIIDMAMSIVSDVCGEE